MAEEFRTPQSANEAILQNILGAENILRAPESRVEKLLLAILGEDITTDPPQSVIEDLLLQIKEQGIGGVDEKFIEVMNKTVQYVTADELQGVTKIKDYAFDRCENLWWVLLPESVKEIGNYAFCTCRVLGNYNEETVFLPQSVEFVGNSAFAYTDFITFVLPPKITIIPQKLLYACPKLKSVEIQGEIKYIYGGRSFGAFGNCSNLETVTFRSVSVPSLGAYTFDGCNKLTNIYVPAESVESYKQAANWSDYADIIKPIGE